MQQANQDRMEWTEQRSPSGKFCIQRKHISLALGGLKDVGTFGGGHPFDVELARMPPGAVNWPFHSHAAQWELFLVLQGQGEARAEERTVAFTAGDCLVFPPGEAHQLTNTGADDLVYYVIADQPAADVMHYPDSQKWFVKPQRKVFRMQETDYNDGEDPAPGT